MKRVDIKTVFDRIKPDISAKERMLENILNHSEKRKENTMLSFHFKKAIPALALVVVFTGGILIYGLKGILFNHGSQGNGNPEIAQHDMIDKDINSGREDMAAQLLNQFQIGDRHYILMSDYVEEFGFPAIINKEDIGPKIMTIEKSPDESLIGCEIFQFIPADCEAIVAVKRDNAYELFRFYTFESYINNQDEDAIEYLKLYGIEGPEDIDRIQFIVHTEESRLEGFMNIKSEITARNEIAKFYSFYSVLKNSSDKYFEKLFAYNRDEQEIEDSPEKRAVDPIPPDHASAHDSNGATDETSFSNPDYRDIAEDLPLNANDEVNQSERNKNSNGRSRDMTDTGEGASVASSEGSTGNALADPVTIRIYNQKGVYFETMYYKDIGFISRYEITAEFAAFIENYIK
ncbi:MAG: hypothetical protein ACOX6S_08425 [Clostridia bacterium]